MSGPSIQGPRCNVPVTAATTGVPPAEADNRYDGYLAVDPSDPYRMVGVCRHFYGPGINYQDILEAQFTLDGGLTWFTSPLPMQASAYSASDPWIGIGPDSTVYVIGLPVLPTNGATLGSQEAAQSLVGIVGQGVNFYANKDHLLDAKKWIVGGNQINQFVTYVQPDASDQTFGGVDQTSGNIYAIWMHYSSNYYRSLAFAFSVDGGVTWLPSGMSGQSVGLLPGDPAFFDLQQAWDLINMGVGPDGSIHIVGIDQSQNVTYGRSMDGGFSFEFGVIASEQPFGYFSTPSPPYPAVVNPPSVFAGANGLLIAAWTVGVETLGTPTARICVAVCNDNGNAWLASGAAGVAQGVNFPVGGPVTFLPLGNLADTADDQYSLPRLAGTPDGIVGCLFSHCQLTGNNALPSALFSTCLSVSHVDLLPRPPFVYGYFDPRATTTVVVSDQARGVISSNQVCRWGNTEDYFIGDFLGLCASKFGFFPYWSDTRSGSGQIIASRLSPKYCSAYIRHYPADLGNLTPPPPGQTVYQTPDMVVRRQPDGDVNFSWEALFFDMQPQDLYIYVRIFNQGPAAAVNAQLNIILVRYVPTFTTFYPADFFYQDWSINLISEMQARILIGSYVQTILPNSSAILGPITILADQVPWPLLGGIDIFQRAALLALLHVDNDDGNGSVNGCPVYALLGPGSAGSYFWQTNKACQLDL